MTITLLDQQKGKIAREGLLGRLMWFSVPEATLLDEATLAKALTDTGLARPLPGFPRDHDVFRSVTTDAQRRKVPHGNTPNQFENWMIRDVASRGEDTITRRIVCEVVDPAGRRLDYTQVADLEFVRPLHVEDRRPEIDAQIAQVDAQVANLRSSQLSRKAQLHERKLTLLKRRENLPIPVSRPSRINYHWLNGNNEVSHPTAQDIMAQVAIEFNKWKGKVGDGSIRLWIRHTILAMGATPVRSTGGIYFLKEQYADQVEALEKFCAQVLPPGGECHSVEIPDNDKQRELIRRSIEAETVGAIERKMVEVGEIRKAGKVTPQRYLDLLSEIGDLRTKMKSYTDLLETDLSAVSSRLQLLEMQTKGLSPLQKKRGAK